MKYSKAWLATLFFLLIALTPSPAYIDSPAEKLTLPQLILEFRSASVLEVKKVDLERGVVHYKSVEQIQGPMETQTIKHSIRLSEAVPAELKGLKPGHKAIFFSGDGYKRSLTLAEGAWYCSTWDSRSGWWHIAYTASHYDFNCAFTGSVPDLTNAVHKLLRGDEVLIRCRKKSRTAETQMARCTLREPRRKEWAPDAKIGSPAAPYVNVALLPLAKLLVGLKDQEPGARVDAALALGQRGEEAKAVTPALTSVLAQEKDPFVRRAAAVALGQIGPEANAAIPVLLAALQSHYENIEGLVGSECSAALARIDPEGKITVVLITSLLKDPSADKRLRAAQQSAILGPVVQAAAPALINALRDKEAGVRHAAAVALSSIRPGAELAVPAFVAALSDPSKYVRLAAARGLTEIGAEARAALPALQQALHDSDAEVRQSAAETVKSINPP